MLKLNGNDICQLYYLKLLKYELYYLLRLRNKYIIKSHPYTALYLRMFMKFLLF